MKTHHHRAWCLFAAAGFCAAATQGAEQAAASPAGAESFGRTRVIGYSQVGQARGGWFVADGVFESIVGNDRWELLWNGRGGVDQWRKPDYAGWSRPLISPCPGDAPPDRVLLSVSGPYGSDEAAWVEAIEATLANIRTKYPSVRQIILQPVVGAVHPCPAAPGRKGKGDGRVRASWQHAHIANAIRAVVKNRAADAVSIIAGYEPKVRGCDDYTDSVGHLTEAAAKAVGRAIAEYYAMRDARTP